MRKEKELTDLLRRLAKLLGEEAQRNPEFAEKLATLLVSVPGNAQSKGKSAGPAKEIDLPDIYAESRARGEDEFRLWLRDEPMPVLRSLIKKHDLDPTRRTSRWKDPEKLAGFIADQLNARLAKGSSFMRRRDNSGD